MKKSVILWGALLLVIAPMFVTTSCSKKLDANMQTMIDSLEGKLKLAQKNLTIDDSLLSSRIGSIEKSLRFVKNNYSDTISEELGNNFTKFKAIFKQYKRTGVLQDVYRKELASLEIQLKNLEKDATKMSKEQFKEFYKTENADAQALVENTTDLYERMYNVEPEYQRLKIYFDSVSAKIPVEIK